MGSTQPAEQTLSEVFSHAAAEPEARQPASGKARPTRVSRRGRAGWVRRNAHRGGRLEEAGGRPWQAGSRAERGRCTRRGVPGHPRDSALRDVEAASGSRLLHAAGGGGRPHRLWRGLIPLARNSRTGSAPAPSCKAPGGGGLEVCVSPGTAVNFGKGVNTGRVRRVP